jgi:type III restriction enzyme
MIAAAIASSGYTILPLKPFQEQASETILGVFQDTAAKIDVDPARRHVIALAQGVVLLRSPTGSGKTLTMGRALERTVGGLTCKTVWFWFAPYSGLVSQTRDALMGQCPALRVRDLKTDRSPRSARDGDVFVATWASVASATKDARIARQEAETLPSIDLLAEALRADGWHIGAIIDEAHANFGSSAKQAADFYLKVLRPDFTMLATATPKDKALEGFERATGMKVNRVEVGRDKVVRACLNKVGVKAVHFRPDPRDESLLDMEEVAVYAGLARHRMIKKALADAGVKLTPLLMIQVDNDEKGQRDPVEKIRDFLKAQRVPMEAVAVHTSGEPDPYFHTLAYDETKEILIFKVAAATGFDAPRAWTLVSLRKGLGVEFGLQVLGRIMRVHPRVQHLHPFASEPPCNEENILDFGYVFLATPAQQVGIATAADEIKTIQNSIETVTDNVVVIDFGASKAALLDPKGGFAELLDPPIYEVPAIDIDDSLAAADDGPETKTPTARTRAAALKVQTWLGMSLPTARAPASSGLRASAPQVPVDNFALAMQGLTPPGTRRMPPDRIGYPLRTDIEFPRKLAREVMPRSMEGLVQCIAQRIKIDDAAIALVNKTKGKVLVTEEDVFGTARTVGRENVPLSNLRIAQQAQMAFRFNESIDDRDLKPALLERLKRELEDRGHDVPEDEKELRRAVDLLALARPDLLHDACRACLAQVVEIKQDEEIPAHYEGPNLLERARKSLYGVFPADLNEEELAFARLVDDDQTGTIMWWLRNLENTRWAVSIVLPNGRRHFPDFVIGVDARRKSKDGIALVEVKDDGRTGRLFSTVNTEKVRTEHREYRSALMIFRDDRGEWFNVAYRADIQRHHVGKKFDINDLIWTQQ